MADKAASNEFENVREFAERIDVSTKLASLRDTLPPLLSKRKAAEVAGVSESTIRRMCERGELTCCRFGNRWRINRDALLAYAGLE